MKKFFKESSDPAPDPAELPPPPYSQSEIPVQNNQPPLQPLPPHKTAESSTYPPQAHHTQSPSRVLHVCYDKWHLSPARILDSDKATLLYTTKLRSWKPHLRIYVASPTTADSTSVGSVSFHEFSSGIEANVHDVSMTLNSRGIFKCGHTYSSPAFGGACLTWKRQHHSFDLVCLDEREVPIARLCFSCWSWSKLGRLELMSPDVASGPAMEEMLVTGLAMMENFMVLRYGVA